MTFYQVSQKSGLICEEGLEFLIFRFPPPLEPGVTPVSKGTIEIRSVWVPGVR